MDARFPLTMENMNPNIIKMKFGGNSSMEAAALQMKIDLKKGIPHPFDEVIECNLSDPQAMGQKYIKFIRQVVALVLMPELEDRPSFPTDAIFIAKRILKSCVGQSVGSYTESTGIQMIRADCADYIFRRDGINSLFSNIFVSSGSRGAIKVIMQMMDNQQSNPNQAGIMLPIPHCPFYSATISEYNIFPIGYYLDEDPEWSISEEELERSFDAVRDKCIPRAIIITNPGNPTGHVLTKNCMEMVIRFAYKHNLIILADEVYQLNVYSEDRKFISFKKVLHDLGGCIAESVSLASFMSSSKGYMAEGGFRGGYCELENWSPEVKVGLYKCLSARSCSPVLGQIVLDVVVNPPQKGDESFEEFEREKNTVLKDLQRKVKMVTHALNSLEGYSCNTVHGAFFAFPKIELPLKAIEAAKINNLAPDLYYCMELLKSKGVCLLPGSEFGQNKDTFHFRITILPTFEKLEIALRSIKVFHEEFLERYK